jgi:molybdopterin-guanine dinucleotide biosynthesis protein A
VGARLSRPAGAILAGGSASRFGGTHKGLLEVGGRRIIDRVAAALRPVVSELLLVSGSDDAAQWLPGARVVHDVLTGGGSAAGVHAALVAARGPVIVLAWDMPFVTPDVCVLLANAAAETTVDAVAPRGPSGALEPLCAWYSPACVPAIEQTWAGGDRSLHGLFDRVRSLVVDADRVAPFGPPERLFLNVNDASDLERAMLLGGDDAARGTT